MESTLRTFKHLYTSHVLFWRQENLVGPGAEFVF